MDFDLTDILKEKIEHKIGHKLKTPTDFNLLSLAIDKGQGETVSFCEGNPLYMTNLQQGNGKVPKNYVAGMRNGIRNVKLSKKK